MAAVGAAAALVLAGGARAEGADGPTVRVLLIDHATHVKVQPAGERRPRDIRRASRRRAGRGTELVARFGGPGPHRVDGRRYRGAIEVRRGPKRVRVVNELALEPYVAGTLLGEVHERWGSDVLRAQAVAIRSYALHRRARAAGRPYDVEADVRGQVYLGMDGESEAAWRAVADTRGEMLAWDGEPILAAFHATAGGRTASAAEVWGREVPYLVSVPVEGEEVSPDTYWRASVAPTELARALSAMGRPVGSVRGVEVVERTASGRCAALRVRGSRATTVVPAVAMREALGPRRLRSTLFEVRRSGSDFLFVGSGFGHGVGMSQWGALAMAERGAGYRAILERFYPGARLGVIGGDAALAARAIPARGASR
jgi:stage II sporulation protein D